MRRLVSEDDFCELSAGERVFATIKEMVAKNERNGKGNVIAVHVQYEIVLPEDRVLFHKVLTVGFAELDEFVRKYSSPEVVINLGEFNFILIGVVNGERYRVGDETMRIAKDKIRSISDDPESVYICS